MPQVKEAKTPVEIFLEVDAQPLLRRAEIFQTYQGMEVDWPVTLVSAWESGRGKIGLAFRFALYQMQLIFCEVSLRAYPRLREMHKGESLRVIGSIRKIDNLAIELNIVKLVLSESAAIQAAEPTTREVVAA